MGQMKKLFAQEAGGKIWGAMVKEGRIGEQVVSREILFLVQCSKKHQEVAPKGNKKDAIFSCALGNGLSAFLEHTRKLKNKRNTKTWHYTIKEKDTKTAELSNQIVSWTQEQEDRVDLFA